MIKQIMFNMNIDTIKLFEQEITLFNESIF